MAQPWWMVADLRALISEFHRRGAWLTRVAAVHFFLAGMLLALMALDPREITGVSVWLKPAKFALSITVYLLTMAWLLGELRRARRVVVLLAAVIIGAMLTEQLLITLQAARGTTSHYNSSTPFDSAVFSLMGFGVAANSAAALIALLLFMGERRPSASAYLWGIRLGLAIFLVGSAQGFVMIANAGHTVGAPDGGAGIPVLAWSSVAGDLRVAHFIGIHALQVLPLAGFLIDRWVAATSLRIAAVWLTAAAYAGFAGTAHLHALRGLSWFPLDNPVVGRPAARHTSRAQNSPTAMESHSAPGRLFLTRSRQPGASQRQRDQRSHAGADRHSDQPCGDDGEQVRATHQAPFA
jgi:hypothetical protein